MPLIIKSRAHNGFTLVELSLSMAFISILSIIVVVMISNSVSSYHKGLTFNQLNTAGMAIVEEMRTTIQASPASNITSECSGVFSDTAACEEDQALSFVYKNKTGTISYAGSEEEVPLYGVFCTGAYSYLWNSGYLFNSDYDSTDQNGLTLTYQKYGDSNNSNIDHFKLLKIQDKNRLVCKSAASEKTETSDGTSKQDKYLSSKSPNMSSSIDISSVPITEDPIDLLDGSSNLRIYNLIAGIPAENGISNNNFYSVSFILGTVQGGIDISTTGTCTPPEDDTTGLENFDYCAINKFNFSAIANGRNGG